MEYSNTAIDIIDCFVLFAFRNLLSSITTISMISKQIWRHSIEDNKKEQKIPYHKNLSTYKRKGSNLWIRKKVERIFFSKNLWLFFHIWLNDDQIHCRWLMVSMWPTENHLRTVNISIWSMKHVRILWLQSWTMKKYSGHGRLLNIRWKKIHHTQSRHKKIHNKNNTWFKYKFFFRIRKPTINIKQ